AKGAVKTDTHIVREPTTALDTLAVPDTAIDLGARDNERALRDTSMLVGWCRDVSARIGRMVGLFSGCFFLAEAVMLDGRRATTHWSVAPLLRARYPA
ncbi:GlxA family transcriptional regulator, partial [Burkholderia pseudomallei]